MDKSRYEIRDILCERMKIDENGCWIWQKGKDGGGYGKIWLNKKDCLAHRVSYELFVDSDIIGEIDHLCKIRECINPSHLEDVDTATNIRRSKGHTVIGDIRYCKRGHALVGSNNVKLTNGKMRCRKCHAERQQLYRQRQKLI